MVCKLDDSEVTEVTGVSAWILTASASASVCVIFSTRPRMNLYGQRVPAGEDRQAFAPFTPDIFEAQHQQDSNIRLKERKVYIPPPRSSLPYNKHHP